MNKAAFVKGVKDYMQKVGFQFTLNKQKEMGNVKRRKYLESKLREIFLKQRNV